MSTKNTNYHGRNVNFYSNITLKNLINYFLEIKNFSNIQKSDGFACYNAFEKTKLARCQSVKAYSCNVL